MTDLVESPYPIAARAFARAFLLAAEPTRRKHFSSRDYIAQSSRLTTRWRTSLTEIRNHLFPEWPQAVDPHEGFRIRGMGRDHFVPSLLYASLEITTGGFEGTRSIVFDSPCGTEDTPDIPISRDRDVYYVDLCPRAFVVFRSLPETLWLALIKDPNGSASGQRLPSWWELRQGVKIDYRPTVVELRGESFPVGLKPAWKLFSETADASCFRRRTWDPRPPRRMLRLVFTSHLRARVT